MLSSANLTIYSSLDIVILQVVYCLIIDILTENGAFLGAFLYTLSVMLFISVNAELKLWEKINILLFILKNCSIFHCRN